mmetsp:Transcript_48347/g.104736  ORF Transcript_48347/g.104736 Transcript_48347/m.104736 type:complete len:221 (+) Transcript_48347:538-1200(+)|eukprot:6213860-Pleurochrysis_carterae.AAC.2
MLSCVVFEAFRCRDGGHTQPMQRTHPIARSYSSSSRFFFVYLAGVRAAGSFDGVVVVAAACGWRAAFAFDDHAIRRPVHVAAPSVHVAPRNGRAGRARLWRACHVHLLPLRFGRRHCRLASALLVPHFLFQNPGLCGPRQPNLGAALGGASPLSMRASQRHQVARRRRRAPYGLLQHPITRPQPPLASTTRPQHPTPPSREPRLLSVPRAVWAWRIALSA